MNTNQFLSVINENLSFFKDKKFLVQITQKDGRNLQFEFETYSAFIAKIKKLGAAGAGFNFLEVQNSCCSRQILKSKNFEYWLCHGSWDVVKTYATFVNYSNLKTA